MSDHAKHDARSQKDRMLAGDLYIADDPELTADSRRAYQLSVQYDSAYAQNLSAAQDVLLELLGSVGAGVHIKPPFRVDYGKHISIGDRTFANYGLIALDVTYITIGKDVQIGPNVQLLTPTHPLHADTRRDKWEAASPIVIGDNVWLGAGVMVLAGVTIGENSVIGAGAVVTKNIPANVVAVGNPARVVKDLPSECPRLV